MPASVVKPGTEGKWEAAKKSVRKSYPNKKGDSFWALVNYVYGQMTHRDKTASRMESAKSGVDTKSRTSDPDSVADVGKWLKDVETERLAADGKGGYLITEADGTKHLPTRKNGKPDHGLMGGAWAALHGGYRGNKYEGPGKQAAISKLKALYKSQGLKTPDQKESAAARAYQTFRWMFGRAAAEEVKKALASERIASAQTVRGTATCAVAIAYAEGDTGAPEWVELIPGGKFSAVDGRGPFKNENPEKIIAASLARMPQVGLVLDYDHSTDLAAPEGRQSPAAGWIKGFKVSDRGAIFARIEWTKRATELLKDKEYRYISPVFEHDDDNKVECVLRAALTNNPALIGLPALAGARIQMAQYEEQEEMSTEKLAKVFPRRKGESLSAHLARLADHAHAEESHAEPDGDEAMNPPGSMPSDASDSEDMAVGKHPYEDEDEEEEEAEGASAGMGDKYGGGADDVDPYRNETEEQMRRRQDEEMAKCGADEQAQNACRMRHMAQMKRFNARKNQGLEVEAGRHGVTQNKDDDDDEAMRSKMAKRRDEEMRARMSGRPGVIGMTRIGLQKFIQREVAHGIAQHPQMLSAQKTIGDLRAKEAREVATNKVEKAIREGRLIPSQREWAIEHCSADPKSFEKFISAQPRIIQSGADNTFTARIGEPPGGELLNKREMEICQNLGLPGLHGQETVINPDGKVITVPKPDRYIQLFTAAKKARLSHNVHLD